MTNPIPTQTANGSFNGPRDFMSELHRVAGRFDKSFGEFVRVALCEAVERHDMKEAAKLRAMLREYYGKVASLVCAVMLVGIAFGDSDIRKPQSRVRTRNSVRREVGK